MRAVRVANMGGCVDVREARSGEDEAVEAAGLTPTADDGRAAPRGPTEGAPVAPPSRPSGPFPTDGLMEEPFGYRSRVMLPRFVPFRGAEADRFVRRRQPKQPTPVQFMQAETRRRVGEPSGRPTVTDASA